MSSKYLKSSGDTDTETEMQYVVMGDVVEYVQRDQKERVAQCSQGKSEGQERPHRGGSRKHLLNKKSASLRFTSTCFGHSITDRSDSSPFTHISVLPSRTNRNGIRLQFQNSGVFDSNVFICFPKPN